MTTETVIYSDGERKVYEWFTISIWDRMDHLDPFVTAGDWSLRVPIGDMQWVLAEMRDFVRGRKRRAA